jgi:hypothetical protein
MLELLGAHHSLFFQTDDTEVRDRPARTEIVFKRYGAGYVLKDIYLAGSTTGVESLAMEAERHAAKAGDAANEHRIAARKKQRPW